MHVMSRMPLKFLRQPTFETEFCLAVAAHHLVTLHLKSTTNDGLLMPLELGRLWDKRMNAWMKWDERYGG